MHSKGNHGQNEDNLLGVPAAAQWVKDLTAATWVVVEARIQSLVWCIGSNDMALPQLRWRSQLWLEFNPWPGVAEK